MQTTVDFIITPILIGAIEATLIWNRIPNANHATTSSQLIPLFLSITLLLFVLCQLLISIGENIRPPTYHHSSSSSDNTTEHIYASIPFPCPCGRSGCGIDEKYYSYPTTSSGDPSHPVATHTTGGYCSEQRYPRRTRIPPPAPTVVSTLESSSSSDSSARTDKADSGASSSAPHLSPKGGSPKKGSVEGGSKVGESWPRSPIKGGSSSGSGGPKGPRPISGQSGSSSGRGGRGFGRVWGVDEI